jgi:hypothetical protein
MHHIIQHLHKQGTELKDAWAEVRTLTLNLDTSPYHTHIHTHSKHADCCYARASLVFQLFYTTVFGCYSAFLFLRTGSFFQPTFLFKSSSSVEYLVHSYTLTRSHRGSLPGPCLL